MRSMSRAFAVVGVVVSSAGLARPAHADVVVVKTYLTGGYHASGAFTNSYPGQNYRVGHSPITTDPERRNFFLFDFTTLPALPPGAITAGSLKLYVPFFAPGITIDPGDGYISPDPFEVYRVTTTPYTVDEMADPTHSAAAATAIFATLGTGLLMGEVAVSPADKGTFLDIPLTPAAVTGINAMMGSGKLAVGGRITSLSFIPPDELLFGFTDMAAPHMEGKEPYLSLTVVPAPAGACLFGTCFMLARRRRA